MNQIYIAKAGKTFGPFTQAEIETKRASGELASYNWIWNETSGAWEPVDAAPAPPMPPSFVHRAEKTEVVASSATTALPPARTAPVTRLFSIPDEVSSALQAICHDHLHVVAGQLKKAGESGCDFLADSKDATPIFMKDMPVRLNILDPNTGASMTVRAQVVIAQRDNGLWKYRLTWESCPEIILNNVPGAA
jgi:hypothetical protein